MPRRARSGGISRRFRAGISGTSTSSHRPTCSPQPSARRQRPWSGSGARTVYYAVDQDTGALVWQQTVVAGGEAGGFSASTGVAFGKVYAGTFTGPPYIFALDATNGAVAWQCPTTECNVFSFGPVGIAAGVVFVGDSSRQLRAFDSGTGALLR